MDPNTYTRIGHSTHSLCSPLDRQRLEQLLELLQLKPGARVLDLCAGKAEISLRLLERYACTAVAVDQNPAFLAEARESAERRGVADRFVAIECDAATFRDPRSFDLVLCVGARPCGTILATLRHLMSLTRAGGELLVGEGYWRSAPDPEYVRFLGEDEEGAAVRFADHPTLAEGEGLVPLYATGSTVEEFDAYDGRFARALERHVLRNPQDPDSPALAKRIRAWRHAFLKWGRDSMGFGWYLYARP